jgi:hypothetical protein
MFNTKPIVALTAIILIGFFQLPYGIVAQVQNIPGQAIDSKYLTISSLQLRQDQNQFSNRINVAGVVANNSTSTEISFVKVVAILYDDVNRVITVADGSPTFSSLKPGQDSPFSITVDIGQDNEVAGYQVFAGGNIG